MGQGGWDNADDAYPELEAAYVDVIDLWGARVEQHRATYGHEPAYLVLHGDVLDFWSADLHPAGGWGPALDVDDFTLDEGVPVITDAAALDRLDRIMKAHSKFFDKVTGLVSEDLLNFVIYVCGNHDDHLVRYGLGDILAHRLHSARGAFASQSVYFPDMFTFIEHGHRNDEFNSSSSKRASLGEVLVSMLVNPVERGGVSLIQKLRQKYGSTGPLQQTWWGQLLISPYTKSLEEIYSHLGRRLAVDTFSYYMNLGCIDNLSKAGMEEVVADYGGHELAAKDKSKANDADVAALDSDLDSLKAHWLIDEAQSLQKKLGVPLVPLFQKLKPSCQTNLISSLVGPPQPERLSWVPKVGLFGRRNMRIHVVGHTHTPEETGPPINGMITPAQHVNTGTGQDTWDAIDGSGPFDTGSLKPTRKSQFCIIRPVDPFSDDTPIYVEGGHFRSIQSSIPVNVRKYNLQGALGGPRNIVY